MRLLEIDRMPDAKPLTDLKNTVQNDRQPPEDNAMAKKKRERSTSLKNRVDQENRQNNNQAAGARPAAAITGVKKNVYSTNKNSVNRGKTTAATTVTLQQTNRPGGGPIQKKL